MVDVTWLPWLSGGLALVGALILLPFVIRLAHRWGWLAQPTADRWHERPTALMGGIGIYAAATGGLFVAVGTGGFPWLLWGGATLLFLAGLADDLFTVRPAGKLIVQVLATVFLLYAGYSFGQGGPFWLTIPLTFLWVIGLTNAVNLLDNMDGLAAGIAMIAALILAAFAGLSGGAEVSVAALLAVAGAAAGFLVFNFKPARIFMGDCGSLFLGYTIAAFAIVIQSGTSRTGGLGIYLAMTAVLAVPIFDTTLVTISRALSGRSVSQGGQDHSSHRLVRLGLSERRAVLTLYAVSLAFGALALFFHVAEVRLFYALAAFFVIGLIVFGIHLGTANVYERSAAGRRTNGHAGNGRLPLHRRGAALLRRTLDERVVSVLRALLGRNWKPALGLAADLVLVSAAFVMAHYLRFEEGLPPGREAMLIGALPAVVGIKLFVFYFAGLYRGIWRHAGTPELVRLAGASTLASVLSYAALAFRYDVIFLSEAVFVIDWLIVTLAVGGIRFAFRGLRQYLSAQRRAGRRVLLCGAGDAGLLTLRALRQHRELGLCPVGFLDEDPDKRGYKAQGLSVLGTFDDLGRVCRQYEVDEVLIPARCFSETRQAEILAACEHAAVRCRVFDLALRSLPQEPSAEIPPAAVPYESFRK